MKDEKPIMITVKINSSRLDGFLKENRIEAARASKTPESKAIRIKRDGKVIAATKMIAAPDIRAGTTEFITPVRNRKGKEAARIAMDMRTSRANILGV